MSILDGVLEVGPIDWANLGPGYDHLEARVFGCLRFVEQAEGDAHGNERAWVECDCGRTANVRIDHLMAGSLKNCGVKGCSTTKLSLASRHDYANAHRALRETYGPASEHVCSCGDRAEQWAYLGSAPDEQWGWLIRWQGHSETRLASFSLDAAYYEPMCKRCHQRYDHKTASRRRAAAGVKPDGSGFVDPNDPRNWQEPEISSRAEINRIKKRARRG